MEIIILTNKMNELVSIFNDDRNRRILNAATEETGISTKDLANKLNLKSSNLYYPIQKLTELQLLEVAGTRQVKNLTEKLYRSTGIFQQESQRININQEYAKQHPELLMALFLAQQQDDRKAYEVNLNKVQEATVPEEELMTWVSNSVKIPGKQKTKFVQDFLSLIDKYQVTDNKDAEEFTISFSMYEKDNN